jgi:hypothetical protein
VSGNQEQIASLRTQIAFLVREQARLTESQRFQLATMLVERINAQPTDAPGLAPLAERIEGLGAGERHGLVARLILTDRSLSEQGPGQASYREPVLRAAKGLAGTPASRAKTAADERLAELRTGTDEEKALVERIEEVSS